MGALPQTQMRTYLVNHIRKTSVLTRSPTNANCSIAAGEVQNRGLELGVAGQIDKRTRLTLDVHNPFDEAYTTTSWDALTVIPGLGRQGVAGTQVVF